jgi:hypothetical protein
MKAPSVARRLVIADIAHQYPVTPAEGAPVFVAELAAEVEDGIRAMEFLHWEETAARGFTLIDSTGSAHSLPPPAEPIVAWDRAQPSAALTEYLRASPGLLSSSAPLMLLRTHTTAVQPFTEVLMWARIRTIGALFVRVARFPHSAGISLPGLIARAWECRGELQDYLRVERNAYLRYEDGVEIEQKVTLVDEASIWAITKDIWQAVEAGEFAEFITDPGYELTRWHFVQHNFEVVGPAEEAGHYAFQELPNGNYCLKLKRFSSDALRRTELFRADVQVPGPDFEGYLAREFPGLRFRRLPSFARVRFDVNVQSVVSGHCFGIETDEVTVDGAGGPKLRQVEIEYLETRRHEGMSASSIDEDIGRLTALVEAHLAKSGVAAERNFYSKLSFLRNCVPAATAASPAERKA